MKNIIIPFILSLLLYLPNSYAADYWYNSKMDCIKITTTRDAITLIEGSQILSMKPDWNGLDVAYLHLFYLGKEMPIYCNSAYIDTTLKLYFVGTHSEGDNTYFNEYSNEAPYFLCFDTSKIGLRYTLKHDSNETIDTIKTISIKWHIEFDSTYFAGFNSYNYEHSEQEGWYWRILRDYPGNNAMPIYPENAHTKYEFMFNPADTGLVTITTKLSTAVDSSSDTKNYYSTKQIKMVLNGDTIETSTYGYITDNWLITKQIPSSKLKKGNNNIEIWNITADTCNTQIALDYIEIQGTAAPFIEKGIGTFEIDAAVASSIRIDGTLDTSFVIIDNTKQEIMFANALKDSNLIFNSLSLNFEEGKHQLTFCATDSIQIANCKKVKQTDYKNNDSLAEMIIIYHPIFENLSLEYCEYKNKQGINTKAYDIDEIYKEFNYGVKNPRVIKNFLAHIHAKQPTIRYCLLIGNASFDARVCMKTSTQIDYIPSYGYPASDYWLGKLNEDENNRSAEIIVGRIPCSTNNELYNYINKVRKYEKADVNIWNKNFLFINGGYTRSEKESIQYDADRLTQVLSAPDLCNSVYAISRTFADSVTSGTELYKNEIVSKINQGTAITIFNGHGSPSGFDMLGWELQYLNNANRTGILATMSCNTGAFSVADIQSINEQYILNDSIRGFVLALGSTTTVTIGSNYSIMFNLLTELQNSRSRRMGDLLESAKQKMNYYSSPYIKIMAYNFGILGDPTIAIKIDTIPDIEIKEQTIVIQTQSASAVITSDHDSVQVTLPIYNYGTTSGTFTIQIQHKYEDINTTTYIEDVSVCGSDTLYFTLPIYSQPGMHTISILADCYSQLNENNKNNNFAEISFEVFNSALLPISPMPNATIAEQNPHFRVANPMKTEKTTQSLKYYFELWKIQNTSTNPDTILIKSSATDEIIVKENYIDWLPVLFLQDTNYILVAYFEDLFNEIESQKLYVPFTTLTTSTILKPELAIKTPISNTNKGQILRGDTLKVRVVIENISLDSVSQPESIEIKVQNYGNSTLKIITDSIPSIPANDSIGLEYAFNTADWAGATNITFSYVTQYDNYTFNNQQTIFIDVYEDTISPTLSIKFDNMIIENKDCITSQPTLAVTLFDNSNLPVTSPTAIQVKINSITQTSHNTIQYDFQPMNTNSEKAVVTIIPQELTDEENYFSFIGIDATGNRVVQNYYLYVPKNNIIKYILTYPNPTASNSDINFSFYLYTSLKDARYSLDIYDAVGKKVITLEGAAVATTNLIQWNLNNTLNQKIASGTYYYRISIQSEVWTDPISGCFVVW